ncbi:DUF2197 domain-containing protein [Salinibacillus xinjiangensis]
MEVTCMTCQKDFEIDAKDPQYSKLKRGISKMYVCKNCNQSIQGQATNLTNIHLDDLDPHNKALKYK